MVSNQALPGPSTSGPSESPWEVQQKEKVINLCLARFPQMFAGWCSASKRSLSSCACALGRGAEERKEKDTYARFSFPVGMQLLFKRYFEHAIITCHCVISGNAECK